MDRNEARMIGEEIADVLDSRMNRWSSNNRSSNTSRLSGSSGDEIINNMKNGSMNFVKTTGGILNDWGNAVSQFGISWNNDAVGLTASVMKTRLSMRDWADTIDLSKSGFTSLGGIMSESAKVFNEVSERFSDTGASDELAEMGINTAEYNKLLGITLTTSRSLNLTGKNAESAQTEAINATVRLAKEMDKVSQISGISHKEQMNILEQARIDGQFQARQRVMRMEGHEAGAAGFNEMLLSSAITGTSDLIKNLAEGGKLSEKSINQLQLMGGELEAKYRAAVTSMSNASTAAEVESAKAKLNEAQAELTARLASKEMLEYGAKGSNKQVEYLREMQMSSDNYNSTILKTQKDNTDKNLSAIDAAKQINKSVEYATIGKNLAGDLVAGSATTKTSIDINRRMADTEVPKATLIEGLNEYMGRAIINTPDATKMLKNVDENGVPFSKRFANKTTTRTMRDLQTGNFTKDLPSLFATAATEFISGIGEVTMGLAKLTDTLLLKDTATSSATPRGYANGTKDEYGSWFGADFGSGTTSVLHGKEAVIPYNKIHEFLADVQPTTPPKVITQEQTNKQPEDISNDGAVMLKNINNQLTELNSIVSTMVAIDNKLLDASVKQYQATRKLSPDLNFI